VIIPRDISTVKVRAYTICGKALAYSSSFGTVINKDCRFRKRIGVSIFAAIRRIDDSRH
jgi:hypothetical protein